jgi:hypothetical protein
VTSKNFESNIVKCSHCRSILSSDEFESHQCNLELKECKTIEVINFLDVSYKNKKLMSGWGIDGILYTFEVVPRKPIPIISPLFKQTKSNRFDEDYKTDGEVTVPPFIRLLYWVMGSWILRAV